MKFRHIISAFLAGMIAGLLAACTKTGEEKENEKPKAEESHGKRGAHGEMIVTLDAETQTRIGLKVETPAAVQWQQEVRGYGHVLDPPAFVKSLASRGQALVRVDLPAGERRNRPTSSARLISLGDSEHPVAAEFFDTAPAVDPQIQGQGFLFLVGGKPPGFSPNAAITAYLKIPGDSLNGVMIPSSALVRYQGKAWVYVQTGDKEFTRREIPLDHPGASGWFVSSGVTDQDRVVASGTQTILSEELNQSGFMGSASVV